LEVVVVAAVVVVVVEVLLLRMFGATLRAHSQLQFQRQRQMLRRFAQSLLQSLDALMWQHPHV
jgi:hypothetical protein